MRKVVLGILLVVALAVVTDFTVAAYSEYRVSRALRAGGELSADPSVTIREQIGSPFLLQAMRGNFRDVEIRAQVNRPDIPGEIVVEASLGGVQLHMGDLVDANMAVVPVDRVSGRMWIDGRALTRIFDIKDLSLTGPAADKSDGTGGSGGTGMTTRGAYILTGTIPLGPEPRSRERVSVKVNLLLDGDQIRIVATDLYRGEGDTSSANSALLSPDLDKDAVLARFTRTIDTRDLPFGVHPTQVQARGGQIVVEGEGENMTIDMDRFARP